MNIEIISGSPRKESVTVRLAVYLQQYLQNALPEAQVGIIDMRQHHLGSFNHVYTTPEHAPAEHTILAQRMHAANAFIIVTPEYNGTYTAEVKNLFDRFPKQSKKPFGIVTASTGPLGGARSTQALLLLVPALGGIASPQMLITPQVDKKFSADGELIDTGFQKSIDVFTQDYIWLVQHLQPVFA